MIIYQAPAQNFISGEVSQNTRWRGEIFINGDVIVPQGVILSIEEGSKIYFKANTDVTSSGKDRERSELIINGVLQARSADPLRSIVFTSLSENPQMNDWYGITVKNFFDKSLLENCVVEFGYKGLTCYGSSPQIIGGEYRFNHHSGISCEVKSNPIFQNVILFGNGFAGINCELASNPVISGCTISENNYGVVIFSRSTPDLGTVPPTGGQSEGRNRLTNNFDFEIYNHSSETIQAQNNSWMSVSIRDIQAVIYDRQDNSSYGEVIFRPIFSERRIRIPYAASVAGRSLSEKPAVSSDTATLFAEGPTATVKSDSFKSTPQIAQGSGSLSAAVTEQPPAELLSPSLPEAVSAFRESRQQTTASVEEPQIQGPLLETFLDSGRRQYVNKAVPLYPEIYRKTGTEGDVLVEVIVNQVGTIENYRVLKSDGDLFTESALVALKKFRYQPGLFKNKPVQFKIIERFRFKLN
ncbi:MAG: TonB family protein [Calditrichaeota bacterium]|nr:TonB family protein [Calditrichota bacterium]